MNEQQLGILTVSLESCKLVTMEEMSPAVAVTLSLGNHICETSGVTNHVEITRLKLMTDTASLLSDPASLSHSNSSSNWDGNSTGIRKDVLKNGLSASAEMVGISDLSQIIQETRNGDILGTGVIQESEDDEILLAADDPCGINGEELLPLDTASQRSLPIAVEIEGTNNGQIVAKVISLEERSFERKISDDVSNIAANPSAESSAGPTLKTSELSLQLPNDKDPVKGGIKSVYELDCLPLWGSVSVCGKRPEMEDAVMAVPHFTRIPMKMFVGGHMVDGISQTLSHLTSHFFGVYDGHGGSQVHFSTCFHF